jgi:hypothetical protein
MSSSSSDNGRCIGRVCGERMEKIAGMKFAPYVEAFCGKACEKDVRLCKTCVAHMQKNMEKGTKTYHGTKKTAIPNWSHIMGSKKTLDELSRLGLTMANLEDRAEAAEKAAEKAARNAAVAAEALAAEKAAKAAATAAKKEATAAKRETAKAEKERRATERTTAKAVRNAEKAAEQARRDAAKAEKAAKKVSSSSSSARRTRKRTTAKKAENLYGMFNPFDPKATAMPPSPEGVTEIRKRLAASGIRGVRPTKNGYKMMYVPASRVSSSGARSSSKRSASGSGSSSSKRSAFAVPPPAKPAALGGAGTGAMEPSMENLLAELGLEQTELA